MNKNLKIALFLNWELSSVPNLIIKPAKRKDFFINSVLGTENDLVVGKTITVRINELTFDKDWNSLMDVVSFIENLEDKNNGGYFDFTIFSDAVFITNGDKKQENIIIINKSEVVGTLNHEVILFEDKFKAVYDACILFIDWYNKSN